MRRRECWRQAFTQTAVDNVRIRYASAATTTKFKLIANILTRRCHGPVLQGDRKRAYAGCSCPAWARRIVVTAKQVEQTPPCSPGLRSCLGPTSHIPKQTCQPITIGPKDFSRISVDLMRATGKDTAARHDFVAIGTKLKDIN